MKPCSLDRASGSELLPLTSLRQPKYLRLIAALPLQVAVHIEDILSTPITTRSYNALKDGIMSHLIPSPTEQLRCFLELEEMGDRMPSQYLWYLMHLFGTEAATTDPEIIIQGVLKCLPVSVHFGLAACLDSPLDTLARVANRMMAVSL